MKGISIFLNIWNQSVWWFLLFRYVRLLQNLLANCIYSCFLAFFCKFHRRYYMHNFSSFFLEFQYTFFRISSRCKNNRTFLQNSKSSVLGCNIGTFTPKGLSVASLHFCICSLKTSGYMLPAPIKPNPPALETAAAIYSQNAKSFLLE